MSASIYHEAETLVGVSELQDPQPRRLYCTLDMESNLVALITTTPALLSWL